MTDTTGTTIIEQTVRIDAAPDIVWTFWTDPARLTEWWAASAEVDAVPGGLYRVVVGEGAVMRGAFTELVPPHRLVFTFGWEHGAPGGELAPGSTTVEVVLQPEGTGTVLTLRHFDLPANHVEDHRNGWNYFLGERLAGAAAGK